MSRFTRKALFAVLVIGVLAMLAGVASAKKPPKPPEPPAPAGVIYAKLVGDDSEAADVCQMNADGGGLVTLFGDTRDWVLPEPSREVHGGRWFLDFQPCDGAYPSGVSCHRLVAVSESGEAVTLFGDAPDDEGLEPIWIAYGLDASLGEPRWLPGDTAVSWMARRWDLDQGTLATDPETGEYLMGIYALEVAFGDGTPAAAGEPILLAWTKSLPVYDYVDGGYGPQPAVWGYDWSPTGGRIALGVCGSGWPLVPEVPEGLYVCDADGGAGEFLVSEATQPRWSPSGTKIAFTDRTTAEWSVGVINADGTGGATVVEHRNAAAHFPHWAPDGEHLVYGLRTRKGKFRGVQGWIYRVALDGSGNTRLTAEYEWAYPLGWRAQ